jgi:excisionase family DNA binding protein
MSNETLWDAKDVAAYLKASTKWVYLHAARGTLPCLHVGGLRRFEPAAIRRWMRGARQAGPNLIRTVAEKE